MEVNTLICGKGEYFYNGRLCEKLEPGFNIPEIKQIGVVHDSPYATWNVYEHEGAVYIKGKTMSGPINLLVLNEFYD